MKEKPFYLSNTEFINSIEIQHKLYENCVPTCNIYKAKNNKLYANINNSIVFLQEWIEGKSLNYEDYKDLNTLGMLAGKLINGSSGINNDENIELSRYRKIHMLDVSKESIDITINIIKRYLKDYNAQLIEYLDDIQAYLNNERNKINWIELPKSLIHGDMHCYNIIKTINDENVIIDFDDTFFSYRLVDVSWASALHGTWKWDKDCKNVILNSKFDIRALKNIMNGFQKYITLTNEEIKAFKYFLLIMIIRSLVVMYDLADTFSTKYNIINMASINRIIKIFYNIKEINLLV